MTYFEMMQNVVKKYGLESKVSFSFCSLTETAQQKKSKVLDWIVKQEYKKLMKQKKG